MSDKTLTEVVRNNKQVSRRTVVLTQNLSSIGISPFYLDLGNYQVDFIPNKVIIRQILYTNIAGTDNGIFLLNSSLTNNNIAAVYYGIQGVSQTPESEFPIYSSQRQIWFSLSPAISGQFGSGSNGAPTGLIAITLEFIRD